MMPGEYVDSPYRHPVCGKRMVVEHGQHEQDGELVESHHCLHCGVTYDSLPEQRALDLPEVSERQLLITLEQMLEIRTRHLDRPEVRQRLELDPQVVA